ncbi:organic hydroperoxide resistance transcriptional regulator [Filimonas lacunae]|nr:organic hydroperoxide resistance transcriptional regulator [Filimonas lacunae]
MDLLKLENQICFPLYAASRQMTALYRPLLEELDLTYPQYLVMMVLWEHQEITVRQLGDILLLDSGTLTPLLKRMEEKGWVARVRSSEDERVVNISLTAAGKKLKQKAKTVPERLVCNTGMEEGELKQLRELLYKMLTQITQD